MSDIAVIGGGLAGGAAAILLARAGHTVQLLEREPAPVDKICGEFLSPGAQNRLAALGLDLNTLGAAPITTLRIAAGTRTVTAPLPFTALGLTRRRLDAALLDLAAANGAQVDRGVTARSVAGRQVETSAGSLAPTHLLIASGKHDLRGAPRATAGLGADYVGFKTYWRLPPNAAASLTGMIDVILFDGGYAGLQFVENGVANLCLVIRKRRLAEAGGGWPALLAMLLREPHLATLLGNAKQLSPRPITVAGIPYGYLHRAAPDDDAFRLGDQAAVIPSFCGEGMAIALFSAFAAADTIAQGASPAEHHRALRRRLARPVNAAMALQHLGERTVPRHLLLSAARFLPGLPAALIALTRAPGAQGIGL